MTPSEEPWEPIVSDKEVKLPEELEECLKTIGEAWSGIPDPELHIAEMRGTEDELLAERKLREQVKAAYLEGYQAGLYTTDPNREKAWESSDSKARLEER